MKNFTKPLTIFAFTILLLLGTNFLASRIDRPAALHDKGPSVAIPRPEIQPPAPRPHYLGKLFPTAAHLRNQPTTPSLVSPSSNSQTPSTMGPALNGNNRELAQRQPSQGGFQREREESARPDQPDEAIRWRMMQMVDENGFIPHNALINAWEEAKQMPVNPAAWPARDSNQDNSGDKNDDMSPNVAGIQPTGWTWLGPGNVGGRIRSIIIHPSDSQTMWVGSVGGGIWKTTNGGTTWSPLNDFMANVVVSCMAIDPANPNVLYAGTGEGFFNIDALRGAGIFKTTDGGTTWTQLSSTTTSSWYYVNRLAINPSNSQIILAATNTGIWRTTDGGSTWSNRSSTSMADIDFNSSDGTKSVASGSSATLFSVDSGFSWSTATGLPGGRVEVAYSRSNPAIVYASVDRNDGEVYRSTDGGHTFALRNTGTNYFNAGAGGQGWYDNIIWVDPTNSNNVIVGGIDLWRSTDGGSTFTKISVWSSSPQSAHGDQHAIVESPQFNGTTNKTVFFGNDGGIYKATDVYTVSETSGWTELNNNLGITQFYGGAGNPTSGRIFGGAQDNGTLRYIGGTETWDRPFGGDGGWCASDPTNSNYFFGEYVYLRIHRNTSGGVSASNYIYTGLTDAEQKRANFIAPFVLDPNDPNTLLGGGDQLWRSANAKATTPSWSAIKPSVLSNISAIAVAKGNSNIIWVGHNNGNVYYTTNGTASSPTWTRADLGTPALPDRYCTRITIDPTNSNRVYATFGGFNSGNVWRTDNNGTNWTNIANNLPNAPVRTLAVWQQNPSNLYVGTEVGIFASADGGQSWSPSNDGPTNCSVDELFWMNDTLVAATHGRGMFSIPITGSGGCTYSLSPTSQSFASSGGNGSFSVTTSAGCAWSAVSGAAWLTTSSTGSGNGTVNFAVAANTGTARAGTISVGGQTFTVNQSAAGGGGGCSSTSIAIGQTIGGSLTTSDCVFTDTTRYVDIYTFSGTAGQQIAITMTSAAFDTYLYLLDSGTQLIAQDDDGNGGTNSRIPTGAGFFTLPATGTYTIYASSYYSDSTGAYSITLASGSNCTYSISPTSQIFISSASTGSFAVSTAANCSWAATSNASWLTTSSSGTGNGTVNYSVALNTGNARTGTIGVGGQTFTVFQSAGNGNGCPVGNISIGQTISATLSTGCVFTGTSRYVDPYDFTGSAGQQIVIAMSSSAFDTYLFLNDPNNQTIAQDDDGGGGTNSRIPAFSSSFTLPVSGTYRIFATSYSPDGTTGSTGAYTISLLSGTSCSYSINPTSQSAAAPGGSNSFGISAPAGCTWTATSNDSWITTSSSGSGNGTINYSVAANSGASRSGTIGVGGQLFTVTQSAGTVNYTIAVSASPAAGGTVSGGGSFAAGSSRTVTATTNSGYTFANWTEGGSIVSSAASYTFTLNGNRTLVANFAADPVNYTITLSASPVGGGSVSGGGTFSAGSSRTVTATPNSNYVFTNWTESGSVVSSSASYTFTLNGNRTLVANFTPVNYTITLSASPGAGGTVSGGGTFAAGTSRTVTATANSGYTFVNWTEGGSAVSSSSSYTFTVNGNRTLVANFIVNCASAQMTSPANGATIAPSTTFTWNTGTSNAEYWLAVGTTVGGSDIYSASQLTATSRALSNLPVGTIYVRLSSRCAGNNAWSFNDYTYVVTCTATPAQMTSPLSNANIAPTTTFTWNAGSNNAEYWLAVGTTPGGSNIYSASQVAATSRTLSNLPLTTIYVRLSSRCSGSSNGWSFNDYTYIVQAPCAAAQMTSPANGATVPPGTTFTWTTGTGNAEYWLAVGTTPGGSNIYNASQGTSTSRALSNLPLGTIYVRLSSRCAATNAWTFNDYSFVIGCTSTPAQIVTPTNNTSIQPTTTFTWNAGSNNAEYWLAVGTTPGAGNIYSASQLTGLSRTLNNLPAGQTIYVRLSSRCSGSSDGWSFSDYVYPVQQPCAGAQMTSPANGTTITPSATFTWTTGTGNAEYWLTVGTTVGGSQIYSASQGTGTSRALSNLTLGTIYVRLSSRCASTNAWTFNDYSYVVGCTATAAQMTSPANGATIEPTATFTWNTGTNNAEYWLAVGTTGAGSSNIYSASQLTGTSQTLSNLPQGFIYVRLSSRCNGSNGWSYNDYAFTSREPCTAGQITAPTNGATISAPVTFTWNTGTATVEYWLAVGTTPGGDNIYTSPQGTNTSKTLSLPDGTVYVRLSSRCANSNIWKFVDTSYTVISSCAAAQLTAPTSGTTLGSSATFTWTTGTNNAEYWLAMGTTPGGSNIYNASQLTGTSRTVSNLPSGTIYVRLSSRCAGNNTWTFNDYTFTPPPPCTSAQMTSPPNGSNLGASATFVWDTGTNIAEYWLMVGTTQGGGEIYSASQLAGTSRTLNNLPGGTIYVRLSSRCAGSNSWSFNDYSYTGPVASCATAQMTSPANGASIPSSSTFTWNTGTGNAEYWLQVGTTVGGSNVYSASQLTGTSRTLSSLPGGNIYVRLSSRCSATNAWSFNDYSYVVNDPRSQMLSPAGGAFLPSSNVTFTWTRGTGVSQNFLYVGNTPGSSEYFYDYTTDGSTTVSGIPTDGRTIYVRLWSLPASGWTYLDYSYTACLNCGSNQLARITSPLNGTTFGSSSVTFNWNAGTGNSQYFLYVGNTQGSSEYLYSSISGGSSAVSGLPTDGRTLWVRIWSYNGQWLYLDYVYKAAG